MNLCRLKIKLKWLWQRKEAVIWMGALILIALSNPADHHYTLCPLDNLGISNCLGCGLGRSIGYFFRFEIGSSFLAHPLGIPAVFLLIYRSVKILIKTSALKISSV